MTTPDSARPAPAQPPPDKKHQDELLDEALAQTFPASDPPSSLHADEPVDPDAGSQSRIADKNPSK